MKDIIYRNDVAISGHLAASPELKTFDSGSRMIRFLVTIQQEHPRRVDVIPVSIWDPTNEMWENPGEKGDQFHCTGTAQRRFWESPDGRRSRVEIVADTIDMAGRKR